MVAVVGYEIALIDRRPSRVKPCYKTWLNRRGAMRDVHIQLIVDAQNDLQWGQRASLRPVYSADWRSFWVSTKDPSTIPDPHTPRQWMCRFVVSQLSLVCSCLGYPRQRYTESRKRTTRQKRMFEMFHLLGCRTRTDLTHRCTTMRYISPMLGWCWCRHTQTAADISRTHPTKEFDVLPQK